MDLHYSDDISRGLSSSFAPQLYAIGGKLTPSLIKLCRGKQFINGKNGNHD
jgi:hypothetical protein